jgi:hypothetical protein
MKAYNLTYNRVRSGIIACNMVLMYKHMYGHADPIRCAPSRYSLKVFGGKLSIEEFRDTTRLRVVVNMPDQIHSPQDVVLRNEIRTITEGEANVKFQEISRTSTNNETLKIKRPKPLKRDENNLEKTLGITRSRKV